MKYYGTRCDFGEMIVLKRIEEVNTLSMIERSLQRMADDLVFGSSDLMLQAVKSEKKVDSD